MVEQNESERGKEELAQSRRDPLLCQNSATGQSDWCGWAEHFESGTAVNRWNKPGNPLWLCAVLYLAELLGRKKCQGKD